MRILTGILLLLIVVLGVTFSMLNATVVTVDLYVMHVKTPLSMLIVASLGIGILIGALTLLFFCLRILNDNRKMKKQLYSSQKSDKHLP